MGLRVRGLLATLFRLEAMGRNAQEEAIAEVKKGAEEIEELAREYAPRDLGDLESAIKTRPAGPKSFTVGVDDNTPSGHGGTVGQYAYLVHEGIGGKDYGRKKREEEGVDAGPFYLSRALEELEDDIRRRVAAALRKAT